MNLIDGIEKIIYKEIKNSPIPGKHLFSIDLATAIAEKIEIDEEKARKVIVKNVDCYSDGVYGFVSPYDLVKALSKSDILRVKDVDEIPQFKGTREQLDDLTNLSRR